MKGPTSWLARVFLLPLAAAALSSCSGGGGGGGAGPLSITNTTVNDGVIGIAYSNTINASGGKGARSFSISVGALPAGLTLSSSGIISGTPEGPVGSASFTVSVTDSAQQPGTDSQAFTINIVDPLDITTTTLPDTSVGVAYSATVVATGGTLPYAYSIVTPGMLPDGLSIGATGAVTGSASGDARSEAFEVLVTDSTSPALSVSAQNEIYVTLEITTTALPDATGGEAYSAAIESQGGLLPLTWSLIAGALPASLGGPDPDTGEISGTLDPLCTATAAAITVQVVDADTPQQTDTQAAISLTVNPAILDIAANTMPSGVINTFYNAAIQVSGGVPPYAFALAGGALPSGLALDGATGQISGTPDTIEMQTFDIMVTDACPNSVTEAITLTINDASLGRNDTIAEATVLPGNGTYAASISPSGEPNTVLEADEDYYEITTTAASTVTVDIDAQVNGSPLDSVIEIVNAGGTPLTTCRDPDTALFDATCISDDEELGVQLDSFLELQVSGATTFYIHVVDWGSNARPDMLYELVISGVN